MKALILSMILLIVGCGQPVVQHEDFPIIGSSVEQFKVVSINRPKHFSISVMNLETGHMFERVGRQKHCNSWRNGPKVGDTISLTCIYRKNVETGFVYTEPSDDEVINLYCK